jgi:plasmid stabilization system protein ParE
VTWQLIVAPETEAEIARVRDWYDEREAGLGAMFVAEVERGLSLIKDNPFLYQAVSERLRRAVLHRFPYNLIYTVVDDVIRVVACVHGSRNPDV